MEEKFDILIKQLLKAEKTVLEEPGYGHQKRFAQKLREQSGQIKQTHSHYIWRAAIIIFIIGAGTLSITQMNHLNNGLSGVSQEMQQTETYFATTINREINLIQSKISPDTQSIIDDGMKQVEVLEKEYKKLEHDLLKSGNDSRVIHAMINNFQTRVEILKTILQQIEDIKSIKHTSL